MKKLLCSFVLLATLSAAARAGEWLYVDIIICEDPPAAISWSSLFVKVAVWDDNWRLAPRGSGGMVTKFVYPTLSYDLVYCDNYLPGVIDEWSAWIYPGKKRLKGRDGKWYQIRWDDAKAYHNKWTNYSTMHLNFDWRIDPDQSAKPDENTPARRASWWWKSY